MKKTILLNLVYYLFLNNIHAQTTIWSYSDYWKATRSPTTQNGDYVGADFLAFVDINNDGKRDMITKYGKGSSSSGVPYISPKINIYINTGNGFNLTTTLNNTPDFAGRSRQIHEERSYFADANGDGRKDYLVVFSNWYSCTSNRVFIYFNTGSAPFFTTSNVVELTQGGGSSCTQAYFADIDNDGDKDVFSDNMQCLPDYLYKNNALGTFVQTASQQFTNRDYRFEIVNYNGGGEDLIGAKNGWADRYYGLYYFRSNNSGGFNTPASWYASTPSDPGNVCTLGSTLNPGVKPSVNSCFVITGDTKMDIVFTSENDGTNRSRLYIGKWNGSTFTFNTTSNIDANNTFLELFDLNNDGWKDLIYTVQNGSNYSLKVAYNNANGGFGNIETLICNSPKVFVTIGNLNNTNSIQVAASTNDSLYIWNLNKISASAGADVAVCSGNSATLTAYGGTIYNWSNGLGSGAVKNVTPVSSTTYTVTITGNTGCTVADAVAVTVYPQPSVGISGQGTICSGYNIQLTANGSGSSNYSYLWAGPGGWSATGSAITRTNATAAMSGTYTVTVTASGNCAATATVSVTVQNNDLNCGLVAHYKLDNSTQDAGGNNNNGTNYNLTPTQDHFGNCNKAMSLNGTNAYLSAPNSTSLNSPTVSITLSGWARSATATSGLYSLFCKVVPNTLNCQYRLYIEQSTKRIYFDKNLSASQTTGVSAYLGSSFDITAWNHYAVSWDGTNARFYLNGQLVGSPISYPGSITPLTNAPLEIGRDAHGTGPATTEWINGSLDDLRIYNRALSAAEISALYTAVPDYPTPADDLNCGQMAWYKFDGTLNDASSNGHTLSLGAGTIAYGKDRKNNCDRSLYLNGSTYLKTPTTPLLESPNYTNQFSVSAWVKNVQTIPSINGEFLSKSSTTQNGLFAAYFNNIGFGCGLKSSNIGYSTTLQHNKWYHMVVTVKNGTLTYYLDGQLIGTKPIIQSSYYSTAQMEIGRHTPGNIEYSNNYLDDLRLYNRALTASEVTLLYNTLPSSPNPVPAASVSSSATAICSGQSVTLTAATNTTGVTYQWIKDNNNISGATGTTYTASQSGSYRVRITKNSGCDSLSLPVTIAVNSLPTALASANAPCAGQNLNLSLTTNGNTYSWTGPASFTSTQQNPIRTNSQTTMSGTYTVTVTNAAGCTTTSTTSVTVKTAPTATVTANSPCAGQNLSLNLTTTGSSYAWAGPLAFSATQQNPVRTNSQPTMSGAYTVTVTNAVGCTTTASVTATVYAAPTVSASANPAAACQGTSVTLNASGGNTYAWSSGLGSGNTKTVTPGTNSTYTVTVTNANGCSGTGSTAITIYPLPNAFAGDNQEICQGGNVTLTATGGTFYNWNNTPGNTATIQVTPVNSTSYVVTVTDGNGCTDTDDVTVTVRPLPVANAGPDMAICLHESALLNAGNGSGFLWSNGIAGPFQYVSPSATTTYTLTVTNQYQCTNTDDVIITVNPLPTGSCFPDKAVYCEGETAVLTALGGVKFYWQHPNGTPEAPVTAPFIIENLTLPLDQGIYPVIVEDANGCRDTTSLYLNLKPSPQVSITGTTPICFEASSIFTVATNGVSFQWSNGDNQHTSLLIFPSSSGSETYAVTVTGNNGCTRSASKVLVVHPRPNIDIKGDERPICIGSDTTLVVTGSGASVYIWNTGQNTNSINVAPLTTTEYRLIGNNQYGCPDTAFATVVVRTPPVAHPRMDIIACMEDREITGLLPEGGKGRWYSLSGAVVQEPDSSITQAMDLSPGFNHFLWKVQTPPCPGEITDTLVVRLANTLPDVNKDSVLVIQETAIELPLFDNDLLGPLSETNVQLQLEDLHGVWSVAPDGLLSFDPENDFTGDVINHYTVCNALCPEYCDSATIVIKIRQPDNDIGETLVITPGDQNGKNDALSFDYLSQYPNNSITIFNRWGQQVYYAKPYNNDWAGAYNGKPLPAGTYYFVLNLIDEDELVWGNILIVR